MEIDLKKIKEKSSPVIVKRKDHTRPWFAFLNKEIKFGGRKFNDTKKERFYNQLGVLFSSGIDLGTALQIIIEDENSSFLKNLLTGVFGDVIAGAAFSEALYKTGQFSDYEYYSIKVGEESGRLQDVLTELTSYFGLRVQQRRQLTGALSYPVMVMIVAVGAVIFMLNVVVPMFAGVFRRFGGELPFITRKVLAMSDWLSGHFLGLFLLIIVFVGALIYLKKYEWYIKYSSLFLLRLPFVGKLISKIMHARFCHSTALLMLAQVPLLDALEMVKKMIGFYPFSEAIGNVQQYIIKGKHMYEGMEREPVFERQLISLTRVGEEVNKVGQLYAKLNVQYTAEVKHMTSILGNMLEPVMIIFVGILVMIILIAMYLPLFQLSTTVV
jgi:type IV pilus assembly protein PilC